MKPRNKFEQAVLAQSKYLSPITKTQTQWHSVSALSTLPIAYPRANPLVWIVGIRGK